MNQQIYLTTIYPCIAGVECAYNISLGVFFFLHRLATSLCACTHLALFLLFMGSLQFSLRCGRQNKQDYAGQKAQNEGKFLEGEYLLSYSTQWPTKIRVTLINMEALWTECLGTLGLVLAAVFT